MLQRRILKGVLAVVTRPGRTLAVAGGVLVGCVLLGYFRLPISTDQNKLFSADVPFFRAYLGFIEKFPENEAAYVVLEAADPVRPPATGRWAAAADAIVDRLRTMPGAVQSVHARIPLDALGDQGLLFEDPALVRERFGQVTTDFAGLVRLVGQEPTLLTRALGRTPAERLLAGVNVGAALRPPDAGTAAFVTAVAESWDYALAHPDEPLRPGRGLPDLAALGAESPRDLGYSYVPDETDPSRHLLLVTVYPKGDRTSLTGISEVVEAIRAAAKDAARPFPEFKVGVTGRPALEADEMRTTDRDSHRAEAVALTAVFIGMAVMLRSLWLALAAELALGVGIGWTFGWASVAVGELNLLSLVFLIALIGIGMDYLVQVLTRYRRERARRVSPRTTWVAVFTHVGPPINTACLGAAGAFFVAVFTDFRGASQLGVIAGGGLLLCLLAGYTVLPALLTLLPGKFGGAPVAQAFLPVVGQTFLSVLTRCWAFLPFHISSSGQTGGSPQRNGGVEIRKGKNAQQQVGTDKNVCPTTGKNAWLRRAQPSRATTLIPTTQASPSRRLLLPAVWLVALLAGLPFAARARFDPGLLNLQAPQLESVQLVRKLKTWSAVVLSDDLAVLRRVREALADAPSVAGTESILAARDNAAWLAARAGQLPVVQQTDPPAVGAGDLERIAAAARNLAGRLDAAPGAAAALRAVADRLAAMDSPARRDAAAARLSAWQAAFLPEIRAALRQFNPAPLRLEAVPPELRSHYVSADGTYALYVHPKKDLWDRQNLAEFVRDVESRVGGVAGSPAPTGIAINIFHSTDSIRQSFVRATAYALALIFVLVLVDLKNLPETLSAISVLALGLPMLVALMGLLGASWNFANFFGLPILIGAGHEYGVFMVHRYREARADPRRAWRGWDVSDRALLLCAFITSGSFGFFWALGHHLGLRSLGLVMMLGTACIYLATVLVLRPVLRWRLDAAGGIAPGG